MMRTVYLCNLDQNSPATCVNMIKEILEYGDETPLKICKNIFIPDNTPGSICPYSKEMCLVDEVN
jgi:hypothetical protein